MLGNVDEVNDLIGSSISISEDAMRADFRSIIKEHQLLAKKRGITVEESLGKEHGLSKYIDGLGVDDNIDDAENFYIRRQKKLAYERNDALGNISRLSSKNSLTQSEEKLLNEQMNKIKAIYQNEHLGLAMVGRDPNIYPMSVSQGYAFIGPSVQEKGVSLGKILLTNLAADADGDGIKVKMLFSAGNRRQFEKVMRQEQKDIASVLNKIKVFGKTTDPIASFSILSGKLRTDAFESMVKRHAIATSFAAYNTKAMTGSMHMAARGIKEYQNRLIGNLNATEDEIRSAMNMAGAVISRVTEQDVISSKHIMRIIDTNLQNAAEGKTQIESIVGLLGGITKSDYLEAIKETEGRLNPVLLFPLWDKKSRANIGEDFATMIEDYNDIMMGMQRKTPERLREIGKNLMGFDDIKTTQWAERYSNPNLEYIMDDIRYQHVWPKMKSFTGDIMSESFKSGSKGAAFVSEDLNAAMTEARSRLSSQGLRESEITGQRLMQEVNALFEGKQIAGIGSRAWGGEIAESLFSKTTSRTMIGASKLNDAFEWLLKPQNLKKAGWAAAGVTLGMAAINTIFGDVS